MNQKDIKERDHQVSLMGSIYSNASAAFAYLGPAVNLLDANVDDDLVTAMNLDHASGSGTILICLDLLSREYWQRLWILQELFLASSVTFWAGRSYIRRESLYRLCSWALLHKSTVWSVLESTDHSSVEQLRAQAQTFYSNYNAIKPLLSFESRPSRDLHEVLRWYCRDACLDPRDKIFGLNALVWEQQ
jgi:hypothetical protein